jgi:acyl transferase domain-containing protein
VAAAEGQVRLVLERYKSDVSIAAINGVASVVISGRSEAVEKATQEFERDGVRVKRLNITYGSHSPAMDRVLPAFYEEAAKVEYGMPRLPIIADMTGEKVEDDSVFNARYWTDHLSRPIQFARCLERLEAEECGLCIEMGPRAVLTTLGQERMQAKTRWVASANGREEDFDALQSAIGEAFSAGAALDWKAVFCEERVRRISLPTYPFERERYWIADRDSTKAHEVSLPMATEALSSNGTEPAPGVGWHVDPGESRLMSLEHAVRKEAARVLGLRRGELPERDARLADMGLDSLMAVTLRNRLQAIVGRGLPPTFAFEYPTSAEMAAALDMLLWSTAGVEDELSSTERDEISI